MERNGHVKDNQYSFYEWFLHEKLEIIKSTMPPSTCKTCGFTTLNNVNGKEYVLEFYSNDIESVNSQIKFWVNEKLPLDVIIQCQERQYIDATFGTEDFEFAEKFK